jgi:5'-nucleotidase
MYMRTKSMFYSVSILLVLTLLLALPFPAFAKGKPPAVNVQILAVNDFHGALNPSGGIGGAAYLATYVKNLAATNPNTVKVSAGDMIGASPIQSALFHDEPTIDAFNLMGFDFSAVGNHEFDEGWTELLRMQNGGCHPVDGCYAGAGIPDFTGASFKYLSANVIRLDNGETLFPAYMIKEFGSVKVAFIGIALESTPTIVVPSGVEGLEFQPEVATINSYVKYLKDTEGIKTFVVLLHDGAGSAANANACNASDPFFKNVVKKIDPEVDALITGHSHNAYNCQITVKKNYGPMLVTSASYNGKYLTDINLSINGTNGQVASATATNINIVDANVTADPAVLSLLDAFKVISAPIANRVIGSITADIKRTQNAAGESALGDVIADAQLEASSAADAGGAVVAMTNPGGIRTDLIYAQSVGEGDGNVTYGEAFAVQPFSNSLVTITLTGDQMKAVLEQQFVTAKMLQISASLTYSWSASAPLGSKISAMKIDGVDVDPGASYRVTVNNFLAAGGDGFSTLLAGTDPLTGMIDLDAFTAYLGNNSPVPPGPMDRVTKLP